MRKNLAIITVVYENYGILTDFLKSLEHQTDTNFHLYIADLSDDKKIIKTKIPHTVIEGQNKGYAYGVNLCIKKSRQIGCEEFCVVNNDIFFEKNFVEHVKKSLEKNPGSLIGGKIYYAPGYEYHKERYTKNDLGKVIWYAGGIIDWKHATTPHRAVDEVDHGQFDAFEKTGFINGALMIFDSSVIDKVGYWDERYFLYFEDSDFCERAIRKGIQLYYDPSIIIWHKVSQSTEGSGSRLHQRYQSSNRLRFGLKYAPLRTKIHLLINSFLKF